MNTCGVVDKQKLIKFLCDEGYLRDNKYEIIPPIKPGHGSCCTCQTCGRPYDECVCSHNDFVRAIEACTRETNEEDMLNSAECV